MENIAPNISAVLFRLLHVLIRDAERTVQPLKGGVGETSEGWGEGTQGRGGGRFEGRGEDRAKGAG